MCRRAIFELYTEEQVHLLPGFPKQLEADLSIAFYVQKPVDVISDITVVPANVLVAIVQGNITQLQIILGNKEIGHVKPLHEDTVGPTEPGNGSKIALGVGLGVAALVLIVVIVLLVCLVR